MPDVGGSRLLAYVVTLFRTMSDSEIGACGLRIMLTARCGVICVFHFGSRQLPTSFVVTNLSISATCFCNWRLMRASCCSSVRNVRMLGPDFSTWGLKFLELSYKSELLWRAPSSSPHIQESELKSPLYRHFQSKHGRLLASADLPS